MINQVQHLVNKTYDLSLFEQLEKIFNRFPDEEAIVCSKQSVSYSKLKHSILSTVTFLKEHQIDQSSRVILLVPNCAELIFLFLALLKSGVRFSPLEIRTNERDLRKMVREYGATHVIYCTEITQKIDGLTEEWSSACKLIPFHCDTHDLEGYEAQKDFAPRDTTSDLLSYYRQNAQGYWQTASFSIEVIQRNMNRIRQLISICRGSTVLCHMPGAHYLILMNSVLPALCSAGKLVLLDRNMSNDAVLEAIEKYNPILMVHYRKYYWHLYLSAQERLKNGARLGNLKYALVNADSPQLKFKEDWESIFGGHLLTGFATVGAGSFVTLNLPWTQARNNAVGKLLPGFNIEIVTESGQKKDFGQWGEIVLSPEFCDNLTFNDDLSLKDESPENPIEWIHTRQLAMMDSDGYTYLADEVEDLIIVSGFMVSPLEIEDKIQELRGIIDVAAVNVGNADRLEDIEVYVQQETDSSGDPVWNEQNLSLEFERIFPKYLRPSSVVFVAEVLCDDEGFKLRKELKNRYQSTESWRSN
jgi:acyl-CoA synthetase (AMP-forming)/AMP-acid ligase II